MSKFVCKSRIHVTHSAPTNLVSKNEISERYAIIFSTRLFSCRYRYHAYIVSRADWTSFTTEFNSKFPTAAQEMALKTERFYFFLQTAYIYSLTSTSNS